MSSVIVHEGGFVEVEIDQGLLVLTEQEYKKALKRGEPVLRNRQRTPVPLKRVLLDVVKKCQGLGRYVIPANQKVPARI